MHRRWPSSNCCCIKLRYVSSYVAFSFSNDISIVRPLEIRSKCPGYTYSGTHRPFEREGLVSVRSTTLYTIQQLGYDWACTVLELYGGTFFAGWFEFHYL